MLIFIGIVLLLAAILIISNFHIVPQGWAFVIERLGKYSKTWDTGLHWKVPFITRVAKKINKMEQVADFPPQPVITKDNVRMQIDTVVFYQITDCRLYTYGHSTPMTAIENLTSTTLRNIIGELELDATLTSRDIINTKMRSILDEATDPWGIKVTRVELKNIIPPKEIQDAMEKQMKAERERREAILRAEGEKNSAILVAEGQKEAAILKAEAEKQSQILKAEALKEAKIREAEGEAEAIRQVQEATATGIKMINEANPGQAVIALKSFEAWEKIANGQSTKIIVPSDMQGLASLAAGIREAADKSTPIEK
ncbi:MAG: SPFH/Band 7/PHB domain protein [Clostridia bacterium]|nr:SPFH/Band 7/PHB domain protein [Clostridia bacterium]